MKIHDCQQGSREWFALRRGVPTASNFGKLITAKTGKLSASADDYICELIAELHFLGAHEDPPVSAAMRHGIDCEPEARKWYSLDKNQDVKQVGFCMDDDGRYGCSPDGMVGDDGLLELKCPQGKTQVAYLLDGGLPSEYRAQVHGQLIVTGRQWCDFLSYCPGLPPLLLRVEPDEYTDQLRKALVVFWERFQKLLTQIQNHE